MVFVNICEVKIDPNHLGKIEMIFMNPLNSYLLFSLTFFTFSISTGYVKKIFLMNFAIEGKFKGKGIQLGKKEIRHYPIGLC